MKTVKKVLKEIECEQTDGFIISATSPAGRVQFAYGYRTDRLVPKRYAAFFEEQIAALNFMRYVVGYYRRSDGKKYKFKLVPTTQMKYNLKRPVEYITKKGK